MAGDQLTFVSGWQEGAVIAAHHAVAGIDRQTRARVDAGASANWVHAGKLCKPLARLFTLRQYHPNPEFGRTDRPWSRQTFATSGRRP